MTKHGLKESLWTMLTGDANDIWVLSNLFGVKYKAMQKDELAHSNMITLVGRNGVIRYQLKGINEDKTDLLEQIAKL